MVGRRGAGATISVPKATLPPLDENDVGENIEYENSYLAGMPAESSNKERGIEQQTIASHSPRSYPALTSLAAARHGSVVLIMLQNGAASR